MFRLRGELRLENREEELAEADFREAIALAQKLGAKSWELRATMSLARLLLERAVEARRTRCSRIVFPHSSLTCALAGCEINIS
jgi:hypothetical protein